MSMHTISFTFSLDTTSQNYFANLKGACDLTSSPVNVTRLPTPADNKTCKIFTYESAQHDHERIKVGKKYSGKDYKQEKAVWPGTDRPKFPKWWDVREKTITTLVDITEHIKDNSNKEVGFMRTCPNMAAQTAKGAPGGQDSTKARTHSEGCTIKHAIRQKDYTHTDEPNQLIPIDIDTCLCPEGMDNMSEEAVGYVISQLPEPLAISSWAYHFSSGAGLESSKRYIKLHLLGIGTIGVKDSDLKAWAKAFNDKGGMQLDATLYDHIHLLYVRDPEFSAGAVDPFKARGLPRCGIVRGKTDKIDTTDIVGFLPPPEKLPVTRSKSVSTKSFKQSLEHIYKDAVALFEENNCHSVVLKTVGRLVNLHYKNTDIDTVFDLVTKASQAAINSGKLKIADNAASRKTSLSRANVEDIVNRSIVNGYGAKPLPIAASVAKKSKYEQFVWALYLNNNQGDALERALTALDIGISSELIGQRFSPEGMIDLILSKHPLPPANEHQLRSRFQYKMECIKQSIAALTEQPQAGYNVNIIPIRNLKQVKTKPGVVTLVCAPMGSGKTTKVAKSVCQSLHKEVTFITHRVSLTTDAAQVVVMHHYQEKRTSSSEGLVACINSISNTNHFEFARDKSRAIIIDEIGQVLREVLMSRTMQGNREQVFQAMCTLMDDKDKIVIGMDANLCRRDVEIIQSMTDKPIEVFIVPDTDPKMNVEILSTAKNARHLPAIMAQDSKAPCVLCADNKHTVKMASGMMEDAGMHGLCVTSETKGNPNNRKALQNINQYVASKTPDFINFSPTISSGVSITHKHFDHIYGIYSAVVEPADFMQMLKRERTVPDVTVVVDRSKSGTVIDQESHTNGMGEMTARPQREILSDVLYMEQLRSKKLRSVLMLHAGIALDYLFRQKKWNITYSDVAPLNETEEALGAVDLSCTKFSHST